MNNNTLFQQTVFLVDDDSSIRVSLSLALKTRGFKVTAFENAMQFLERYDADEAGCVILDLSMPEMSGIELQREMNQRGFTIPVIFITGHGSISDAVKAVQAGAIDFLEKPFRQETLLARIAEAFSADENTRLVQLSRNRELARFSSLSTREIEVLNLLIPNPKSLSSKEIAKKLSISHRTIDHHRSHIFEKTGVTSLAELLALCELTQFRSNQPSQPG